MRDLTPFMEASLLGAPRKGYRDVVLLALCYAATMTSSTLLTTAAPSAAVVLDAPPGIATLTIGIFLLGAAVRPLPLPPYHPRQRASHVRLVCSLSLLGLGFLIPGAATTATHDPLP